MAESLYGMTEKAKDFLVTLRREIEEEYYALYYINYGAVTEVDRQEAIRHLDCAIQCLIDRIEGR